MNHQKISILMPVKNTAQYLNTCLDSIIQQTEKNWELIAVNDFSTDKSEEILKLYAKMDSRIRVYKNPKLGIIPALQFAFSKSQGQYITRMDSDDIMISTKLKILKQQLLISGKGFVSLGLVSYFSEEKLGKGYKKYASWLNFLTISGTNFKEIYKECTIPSPCWMVYKSDLILCDAFNLNNYPEDYDLAFRMYTHHLVPIANNNILHKWRDLRQSHIKDT